MKFDLIFKINPMKKIKLLLFFFIVFQAGFSQTFTELEGVLLPAICNGSVAWGDYDNDGYPDILVSGFGNDEYLVVKIFRNNGDSTFTYQNGIFTPSISPAYNLSTCTALWVDFDNDGYLDVFLNTPTGDGSQQCVVYRNEGNNSFARRYILNYITFEGNSVNCGDYDNDGKQDFLLVTNAKTRMFRNTGNFVFREQQSINLPGAFNSASGMFDYDNDGDNDIMIAGVFENWTDEIKFYQNQGNNVFNYQSGISLSGMRQGSMEWGDFDHDGYPDLLTAGSGITRIYKNNGDNTFTYFPGSAFAEFSAFAGKWGDMDNDGDNDLVLTGIGSENYNSTILINNGDNTFSELPKVIPFGGTQSSVALGDYDNDGDLDVLLSGLIYSTGTRFCKVYRNNTNESTPVPAAPEELISAESGSDMILKWNSVKTDYNPDVTLSYNLMIGTISDGSDIVNPCASNTGIRRIAEMGNGQLDTTFLIRNIKKGNYSWKVQTIDNRFVGGSFSTQSEFTYSYSYQAFGLIAPSQGGTETNLRWSRGNGDNCIVFLKEGNSGYAEPLNNNSYTASGVFKSGSEIPSSGWYCVYKGSADSVLVTGLDPGTQYIFQVLEYDGDSGSEQYNLQTAADNPCVFKTGFFTELRSATLLPVNLSSLRVVQASESHWFDFDNDNDLDLLLTGHSRPSKLYRNDGSGIFTLMPVSLGDRAQASTCGDYNNDGFIDIIINEGSGWNYTIFKNNTNGTFSRQDDIIIPGTYYGSVRFGDYDNDGDLDILLTGEIQGQGAITAIYRNNGNNTFSEQITLNLPDVKYGSAKFGDYDNDGFLDILIYGSTNDQKTITRILQNTGKNSFIEQPGIVLPTVYSGDADWGDYDNDGDLDILMISGSGIKICRNDGDNVFTEQTNIATGPSLQYSSASWGDYDNDGYSDFIISGYKGNYLPVTSIFRNNKNNTFTEDTRSHLTDAGSGSTTWGDFDNDGDLDIIITGSSTEESFSKIFRNDITFVNSKPSSPSGLVSTVSKSDVELKWNSVRSDSTYFKAMTYNVRIGTSSDTFDIVSPHSSASGYRRIAEMGNAQLDTSFILKKLPFGTYYWSVQAVDNGFAGSSFSPEDTFSIVPVQAGGLTARILNNNSLLLKWERGNGDRCVVFCKDTSASNAVPVNNKSYIPDNEFGYGEQIGTSGWYCIYNGRGDSVEVTGLVYMQEYSFHVIEYLGSAGSESYFTELVTGNPGVFSTGLFAEQTSISLGQASYNPVIWGDYDNDGFSDLLLPGFPSVIYKNNGDNTFTSLPDLTLQSVGNGSSAWGDYDNDGDLDILLTGAIVRYPVSGHFSAIYMNEGENTFNVQSDITLQGVCYSSVAWGDYDNDGYIDILITGATGEDPDFNPVSKIYRNNGNGSFSLQEQIVLPGIYRGAVSWVDYDQDGYLDIFLSGSTAYVYYQNTIAGIFRNNGNNTFTEQTQHQFYGVYDSSVDWGDFDNDGYPDLLITTPGSLRVYKNYGGNSFSEYYYWGWGYNHPGHAVWGDYDNDGLLDILLTNFGPASLIIKNTDGKNFVQISEKSFELVYIDYINWCDYDNDGDIDFLVSKFGDISKIYKNNRIMKSGVFQANTEPDAPEGLTMQYTPEGVKLSWEPVENDETSVKAISYNLRYKMEGETYWRGAPHSDDNGFRSLVSIGNISLNTSYIFRNLPSARFYWQVQAIDQGYLGGAWSASDSFVVKNTQAFFLADTVCQGLPTHFADQSVAADSIASWYWDFSDGNTSELQNPEFTFSSSGSFQVKLVITSTEGDKDSLVQEVIVKPKPLVDFSASIACQGSETTLTNLTDAQGLTITSWSWDYGDGKGSVSQDPVSHGYLSAGDYQVTLYATPENGCQGSIQKTVSVGAIPVAAITADAPLTFCTGDSVTLSVADNPGYTYQWRLGGTPVTGAEGSSVKAKQTGSYSVEVINPVGNCTTTSSALAVTVKDAPASPGILAGGAVTFCQGDSVMLSVTYDPDLTYRWKLNGGDVGTNTNAYKAKSEGTYNLVVLNSTGCSSTSTNSVQVTVKSLPVSSTVSLSGPTTFCAGGELTMNVPFTMGYTYRWENESGAIAGAAGNSYQAVTSGTYSLAIGSMDGCEVNTSSIQVTVKPNPMMPVIGTENYESGQCLGDIPIVLRANPAMPAYTYQWKRNGIIIPGATLERYEGVREAGEYTVIADNQGCRLESAVKSIILGQGPPKPVLIAQGPAVWYLACSNDSADQYRWYFDGQVISGANSYIYVANQDMGTYMVAISENQGCYTYSDPLKIPPDAIGVFNESVFSSLKIFPNPTTGQITIEINNQVYGNLIISVYTEEGRMVWNSKYDKITGYFSCRIDLSGNGSGVYFVNLRAGNKEVNRKLVVR